MIPTNISPAEYLWIQVYTIALQRAVSIPSAGSAHTFALTAANLAVENLAKRFPPIKV